MESEVPDFILESVRSLPPLPAAVQRLLELARDPDPEFRLIAAVIEKDQTLTARTLRAANSALYGVKRRIQTVQQAIVLLGKDAVTGLAIGASVLGMQSQLGRRWPVNPEAYWRHTYGVALLARGLARALGTGDPEEAFIAGLLHDIGKTIMLNHFGEVYGQVLMAAQYGTNPLYVLERDLFKMDHASVGRALCLHWKIPSPLVRAVAEHHDDLYPAPNSVADIVRDANELVKMLSFSDGGNHFVRLRAEVLGPHQQVRPDMIRDLVLTLPQKVEEAEAVFGGQSAVESEPDELPGRPLIHVNVTVPEERDMLAYILMGMGYEPVFINESGPFSGTSNELGQLAGFITDTPLTPDRQIAYRKLNVPVLDYAFWRGSREHLIPVGHVNVFQLREWILRETTLHNTEHGRGDGGTPVTGFRMQPELRLR